VGRRIDAAREAADDEKTGRGQPGPQLLGNLQTASGRDSRSDDGDGGTVERVGVAPKPKDEGRITDGLQKRRVSGIVPADGVDSARAGRFYHAGCAESETCRRNDAATEGVEDGVQNRNVRFTWRARLEDGTRAQFAGEARNSRKADSGQQRQGHRIDEVDQVSCPACVPSRRAETERGRTRRCSSSVRVPDLYCHRLYWLRVLECNRLRTVRRQRRLVGIGLNGFLRVGRGMSFAPGRYRVYAESLARPGRRGYSGLTGALKAS
jgi:hypothetical protein